MHILPQALLVSLLATAPAVPGTSVVARQDQAPAQVQGDLERAVEREHQTRSWAMSLAAGKVPAQLEQTLGSESWAQRRAGVDALRRAAPMVTAMTPTR